MAGRRPSNPYIRKRIAERERAAFPADCRSCGEPVLVGLDADVCALTVRVDPAELTAAGELLAIAAGRLSYRIRPYGDLIELEVRDRWQIKGEPALAGRIRIVAEHRCAA